MTQSRASRAFYIAVIVSAVLPFVPFARVLLWPFDYLNTHLHELCHALAALATGGVVGEIKVFADTSGVTYTSGGIQPVIQMAGYLGASLFGAFMVQFAVMVKAAKTWLRVLGVAILLSNILLVRGDIVGWPMGISGKLQGDNLLFAAQFLAVQQCLNSLKALRDLLAVSGAGTMASDAQNLANDTHIPAIFWALLWTGVSVFGIVMAMIKVGRRKSTGKTMMS